MNVYSSIDQVIGNTPLVELSNIEKKLDLKAKIFAKLEYLNPTGSAKDRVAKMMLDDAEREGKIKPGATIIEPTSGNTGIGLASVGAARGYNTIIVMPDTMSKERIMLIEAYGAKVVLTDGTKGMAGSIEEAVEIQKRTPGSFIPEQFSNPSNPKAHRVTTGPEIWKDTDGQVDIYVATVGTGGTLSGAAEYLKEKKPDIKVVAVEPAASPLLTKGVAGAHKIQGIGANFIPDNLNQEIYDEVIAVSDDDAFLTGGALGKDEGFLCGISSGAALYAAIEVAKREENKGKNIVVVLPDSGDRYLSTALFS